MGIIYILILIIFFPAVEALFWGIVHIIIYILLIPFERKPKPPAYYNPAPPGSWKDRKEKCKEEVKKNEKKTTDEEI